MSQETVKPFGIEFLEEMQADEAWGMTSELTRKRPTFDSDGLFIDYTS